MIMRLKTAMFPEPECRHFEPDRVAGNPHRLAQGQVNLCIQRHCHLTWVVATQSCGGDMDRAGGTGSAGRAVPFLRMSEPGSEKRACRPGQPSLRTLRGWDPKTSRWQGSSRVAEKRCVCKVVGVEMKPQVRCH